METPALVPAIMSRNVVPETAQLSCLARLPHLVRLCLCLALLASLAACGGHSAHHAVKRSPSRYYPPPGPASDPWGPYIREATSRFGVPEVWVRRVMRQESGGQEDVISWAGAMGLMQVMPETYEGLRDRYNLGDDAFEPRNNILAGTAYLREMYDRFGAPGFLAAYNAGPSRLDRYLNNGTPLPAETVNYVAAIAPQLGPETPMSGPLAVYASGRGYRTRMASRTLQAGCDPDAAYNPDGPCTPLAPAAIETAAAAPVAVASAPVVNPPVATAPIANGVVANAAVPYAAQYCDPDAAYDPTRPCQMPPPARVVVAQPIEPPPSLPRQRYVTEARPIQERMGQRVALAAVPLPPPLPPPSQWMIQVGAFSTLTTAQAAAERARSVAPDLLRRTKIELPATAPLGNQVAFRARLSGLTATAAVDACGRLTVRGIACVTVPPRDSF